MEKITDWEAGPRKKRKLDLTALGAECSIPPELAILEKRQISAGGYVTAAARVCSLLLIIPTILVIAFFSLTEGAPGVLGGLIFAVPVFVLTYFAFCVFSRKRHILAGYAHCYLTRVKACHASEKTLQYYADIEFSNGHIEPQLFVYAAGKNSVNPGDEVYVYVLERRNQQFYDVRTVSELERRKDAISRGV